MKIDIDQFKKAFNWIRKNIEEINVFLFIIIITLFIIHFGVKINQESIDILVSIAAVVGTFFLYLAFRQSKRSNDLIINEPVVNDFEKRLAQLEKRFSQRVIKSDIDADYFIKNFNYDELRIKQITYKNFETEFRDLVLSITNDEKYIKYVGFIESSENRKYKAADTQEWQEMSILKTAFGLIEMYHSYIDFEFYDLFLICTEIQNSRIDFYLKERLLKRVYENAYEYTFVNESSDDRVDFNNYIVNSIRFEINAEMEMTESQTERGIIYYNHYNRRIKEMTDIFTKYFDLYLNIN